MRRRAWVILVVVVVALAALPGTGSHARAATLLLRFAMPTGARASWPASAYDHPIVVAPLTVDTPTGPTRARLYVPEDVVGAPGLVVVPGVHRLGVDEPRLRRFAEAIASSGVVVMTPEIRELTDYRIDPRSIGTIGSAARDLAARVHRPAVGVLGLSFAGGLSLLAAADPTWSRAIAFVVAVGAHDDLARVARFFVTDKTTEPSGKVVSMRAHDYGVLVLVYGHAEDFFAPEDVEPARAAIRAALWEEPDRAKELAKALAPDARAKVEKLLAHDDVAIANEIGPRLASPAYEATMREVSPHGRLGTVHVPVYLLHGAGDNVIPPSETLWLAEDVPRAWLRETLVSDAIQHVELHGEPALSSEWALVAFMAHVLDETEAEGSAETVRELPKAGAAPN